MKRLVLIINIILFSTMIINSEKSTSTSTGIKSKKRIKFQLVFINKNTEKNTKRNAIKNIEKDTLTPLEMDKYISCTYILTSLLQSKNITLKKLALKHKIDYSIIHKKLSYQALGICLKLINEKVANLFSKNLVLNEKNNPQNFFKYTPLNFKLYENSRFDWDISFHDADLSNKYNKISSKFHNKNADILFENKKKPHINKLLSFFISKDSNIIANFIITTVIFIFIGLIYYYLLKQIFRKESPKRKKRHK